MSWSTLARERAVCLVKDSFKGLGMVTPSPPPLLRGPSREEGLMDGRGRDSSEMRHRSAVLWLPEMDPKSDREGCGVGGSKDLDWD